MDKSIKAQPIFSALRKVNRFFAQVWKYLFTPYFESDFFLDVLNFSEWRYGFKVLTFFLKKLSPVLWCWVSKERAYLAHPVVLHLACQ